MKRLRMMLTCLALVVVPVVAFSAERLIESSEYKDKDFIKGCLTDYTDLVKGEDVNWVWVAPGTKLTGYKVAVGNFDFKTDELRSSQMEEIKAIFKEYLDKLKGNKGTLTSDVCVYEVQKFSAAKAWIPFAGGHQMQAGLGAELLLKDSKGKPVAKFRHFAREGSKVEDAAQEVVEDIKKYIASH